MVEKGSKERVVKSKCILLDESEGGEGALKRVEQLKTATGEHWGVREDNSRQRQAARWARKATRHFQRAEWRRMSLARQA